jgi:hypothetical protein
MGLVKYNRDLKVIAVKLSLCGWTLARINRTISKRISKDSLARWKALHCHTWDVVQDPTFFAD